MTIPHGYGISKIRMIMGDDPRHERKPRKTGLQFSLEQGEQAEVAAEEGPAVLPRSFNVLYVQTPRINVPQVPLLQALAETWEETKELVKPMVRLGLPETTLFTKCPYYDADLAETGGGHVLINSRLRKVLAGVDSGSIYHHPPHHIQHSRLPIPDIPSGSLVLALNLCCYWLLTKQANRLR